MLMAAIISRVKRYLLLITFYLALWADINQNCDYKNDDTSHSEQEHRSRHLACVNLPRFVLTTKVRTRASRFLPGRLQYTSKSDSSFQIERHMLSGDISPNPGPGKKRCKPKYPCKECGTKSKIESGRHIVFFVWNLVTRKMSPQDESRLSILSGSTTFRVELCDLLPTSIQ